jgi:hypothetical protein
MSALISPSEMELLARPHVARLWFAKLDLPSGLTYLHSGSGTATIEGQDWRGVSDPLERGQFVSINQVEEPAFGQATAVTVTLGAANRDFVRSVHATAREIEGRAGDIYWAAFDGETQRIILGLVPLFPAGRMSSPAIQWSGIGRRMVSITIENRFAAQNFPPGGRWNNAGQLQRYPGDLGLEYVGVEISETWK